VEIAKNAREAGVWSTFNRGMPPDMPFANRSFDFMFCQAAFKNFTEPVTAIAEMYRVLRPHGKAVIVDLRRDASRPEIERHIESLGLSGINRLMTRWTFHSFLLKNAYTIAEMKAFVSQTQFGNCSVEPDDIGFSVWLGK
jgi:ubiquinone/menaquinone biosynthesis C-methylase UbiE